ncbi:MAG: leucine-rich repeat domain-containing protein [Acutalibacteraceae bacterium]
MKMTKKFISYLLVFLMVFSSFTILPSEFFHSAMVYAVELLTVESQAKRTYKEGDFSYSIINDNEVEIVSYNGVSTDIVIPDVTTGSKSQLLANKKVTAIGEEAFYGIPITSVTFGKNITDIGDNAFYKNTVVTSVDLSVCTNLATIGDEAFYENSALTTITLPDSLEVIGNKAFYNCKKLTNLKTGNKITDIGKYAFAYCTSLSDVNIQGGNGTAIGYNAFYNCKELITVTLGSGVEYINYEAFRNCTKLKGLTIPNTVINIGVNAFYDCAVLEKITIPDSVQAIGSCAFANNKALKSVSIGSGCSFIESNAFDGDTAIESFTLSKNNSTYSSDDGVLMNKSKTAIILFPKSKSGTYTIPNTVKAIKPETFKDCTKITGIVIGDGIISIGDSAFNGCTNLAKVTFGKKITSIGANAFRNNKSLKEVDLSACSWLTTIGNYAFNENNALELLKLPNSLQTIGDCAFIHCDKFTTLEIGFNITSIGKDAFYSCDSLTTVNIKGGDNATISENAFYYCPAMKSLTIGDDINSIGINAFAACSNLETVTIGSGCTKIDSSAFNSDISLKSITVSNDNTGCSSINGVLFNKEQTEIILVPPCISGAFTIPDTVTEIKPRCFFNCDNLTEVIIGNGVQTIGASAFKDCESLAKVTFGKNITTIDSEAFRYNDLLQTVDLSVCTALTHIGSNAFESNDLLKTVLFPDSLEEISEQAFDNCDSLTKIELKNNLSFIGASAFYDCDKLKTVNFENCNNAVISDYAFFSCDNLSNLTIGNGIKSIGNYAFRFCTSIATLEIGNDVEIIGKYAFSCCDFLSKVIIGTGIKSIGYNAFQVRYYGSSNKLKEIQILGKNLKTLNTYAFPNTSSCNIYCCKNSNTHQLLNSNSYRYIKFFSEVYPTNIKVNGVLIDGFDKNTKEYTVYVDNIINVAIVPMFERNNITYKLYVKDNVYTMNIFNENNLFGGTYKITVKNTGNIYPSKITVNGVSLKDFKPATTEYTVYLDDINNVEIKPVFANNTTIYKVTAKDNVYTIGVFDKNNEQINTYKITVKNLNDIPLTGIKANGISVEDFNIKAKEYLIYLYNIKNVNIVPVFKNTDFSYKVTKTDGVYTLNLFDQNNTYVCEYTINVKRDGYVISGSNLNEALSQSYSTYVCRTLKLKAGTYKFKVTYREQEYGYNITFTDTCKGITLSEKYKKDITLNATSGLYTFKFNTETHKLTVEYSKLW